MFVFWWTGKGYLTPTILFGVLLLFGMVLQAGQPVLKDEPWFWGIALLVAAGANWAVGRRQNRLKIAAVRSTRLRNTLVYRAKDKFMSLPFETWSIPLMLGGVVAIAYSFVR